MSTVDSSAYRDPDGNPLTMDEWAKRFEDWPRRVLANTPITGDRAIVTMWMGYVEPLLEARLFGTALFHRGRFDSELATWDDKATALDGHGWYVGSVGERFFCPRCHSASSNLEDLRFGYCIACHDVTGVPWSDRRPPPSQLRVDDR